MEDIVEIVVTGPDDAMDTIAERLVDERLVACAQLHQVRSTYRWQGAVEREPEARAAMHTAASLVDAVTARVCELHPYEVPAVLTLPLRQANLAYHRWVIDETGRD